MVKTHQNSGNVVCPAQGGQTDDGDLIRAESNQEAADKFGLSSVCMPSTSR